MEEAGETENREARVAVLEKELAEARAQKRDLNDFLENAPMGMHWIDPNGVILWANQAELDLLGYSRDEYVGRALAEFHKDTEALREILASFGEDETPRSAPRNYEAWLRHKDGSLRCVQIGFRIFRRDGQLVHARCTARDITDSRRREQRLRTQNGVAQVLASAATFGEAGPELLAQVGRHLEWRAGYLWVPRGGALHCAASWIDDPERSGAFAEQCAELSGHGGTGLPSRIRNAREPLWMADQAAAGDSPRDRVAARLGLRSAFGFPILAGEEARPSWNSSPTISAFPTRNCWRPPAPSGARSANFWNRRRCGNASPKEKKANRVLTETVSDGIVTIDGGSTILFLNTAAAAMFGYSKEELTGANLTTLMPERLRAAHATAVARYLASGERNLRSWRIVPLIGLHRHGYEFPMELSLGEYRHESGHVLVAVLRDTTERVKLEEKMRQAAKLESLGVLAGGIAHDFNNLLTGVLGNISLAQDLLEPDHHAQSILEEAMNSSERAAHLVGQMLAYAGKGRFVVEPIDVSALVREISTLVKTSIPKHVAVRLDLDRALPLVDADSAQMQQLVMNLVINGAEAVPPDRQGIVLVTTRLQRVNEGGEVAPGDYVAIGVHDNGGGMDDETRAKIFDPFFTTKFTGRGLGLAAASGIVKGHKGFLRVFSTPGQGTTFRVFLPATRKPARERRHGLTARNLTGLGTVLVVDDEDAVLRMASLALTRYGYTAVTAVDGRAGVERFRLIHSELAAVILDMTMPVMGGEQALALMKAIDPAVPVVLSSGYNEAEATARFEGKGLAAFLQKPHTAAALAEKIGTVKRKSPDAEGARRG